MHVVDRAPLRGAGDVTEGQIALRRLRGIHGHGQIGTLRVLGVESGKRAAGVLEIFLALLDHAVGLSRPRLGLKRLSLGGQGLFAHHAGQVAQLVDIGRRAFGPGDGFQKLDPGAGGLGLGPDGAGGVAGGGGLVLQPVHRVLGRGDGRAGLVRARRGQVGADRDRAQGDPLRRDPQPADVIDRHVGQDQPVPPLRDVERRRPLDRRARRKHGRAGDPAGQDDILGHGPRDAEGRGQGQGGQGQDDGAHGNLVTGCSARGSRAGPPVGKTGPVNCA